VLLLLLSNGRKTLKGYGKNQSHDCLYTYQKELSNQIVLFDN
jgi:hypothetical protein